MRDAEAGSDDDEAAAPVAAAPAAAPAAGDSEAKPKSMELDADGLPLALRMDEYDDDSDADLSDDNAAVEADDELNVGGDMFYGLNVDDPHLGVKVRPQWLRVTAVCVVFTSGAHTGG